MFNVTIRYGMRTTTRNFPTAPSVSQIKRDQSLRAELGYGDNVKALINGTEQGDFVTIPNGVSITIETAANQKN